MPKGARTGFRSSPLVRSALMACRRETLRLLRPGPALGAAQVNRGGRLLRRRGGHGTDVGDVRQLPRRPSARHRRNVRGRGAADGHAIAGLAGRVHELHPHAGKPCRVGRLLGRDGAADHGRRPRRRSLRSGSAAGKQGQGESKRTSHDRIPFNRVADADWTCAIRRRVAAASAKTSQAMRTGQRIQRRGSRPFLACGPVSPARFSDPAREPAKGTRSRRSHEAGCCTRRS